MASTTTTSLFNHMVHASDSADHVIQHSDKLGVFHRTTETINSTRVCTCDVVHACGAEPQHTEDSLNSLAVHTQTLPQQPRVRRPQAWPACAVHGPCRLGTGPTDRGTWVEPGTWNLLNCTPQKFKTRACGANLEPGTSEPGACSRGPSEPDPRNLVRTRFSNILYMHRHN